MLTGAADYGEGDVEVDAEFLAASCIDKQLWVDVRRQVVVELRDEEDDHQETTDHRHWNTQSNTPLQPSLPARHISGGAAPRPCCLASCPNSLAPRFT